MRASFQIGLLAALFFGPIALAMVWYFGFREMAPASEMNRGELVVPVRPLPAVALRTPQGVPVDRSVFLDQWTLLTLTDACGDTCRERLANTRKVRALLGRNAGRVQRLLVSTDADDAGLIGTGHPDLKVFLGGGPLRTFFQQAGAEAVGAGVVYLIDPNGNWVLYYPASRPPGAILKDIKHLLKLSTIG